MIIFATRCTALQELKVWDRFGMLSRGYSFVRAHENVFCNVQYLRSHHSPHYVLKRGTSERKVEQLLVVPDVVILWLGGIAKPWGIVLASHRRKTFGNPYIPLGKHNGETVGGGGP